MANFRGELERATQMHQLLRPKFTTKQSTPPSGAWEAVCLIELRQYVCKYTGMDTKKKGAIANAAQKAIAGMEAHGFCTDDCNLKKLRDGLRGQRAKQRAKQRTKREEVTIMLPPLPCDILFPYLQITGSPVLRAECFYSHYRQYEGGLIVRNLLSFYPPVCLSDSAN